MKLFILQNEKKNFQNSFTDSFNKYKERKGRKKIAEGWFLFRNIGIYASTLD